MFPPLHPAPGRLWQLSIKVNFYNLGEYTKDMIFFSYKILSFVSAIMVCSHFKWDSFYSSLVFLVLFVFLALPCGILVPLPEKVLHSLQWTGSPNHLATRELWQYGVDAPYISVFKKTWFNLQHNRSHWSEVCLAFINNFSRSNVPCFLGAKNMQDSWSNIS